MPESIKRFDYLLEKYTNRICTWEEYQELFSYIEKSDNKEFLFQFMDEKYIVPLPATEKSEEEWDNIFKNIEKSTSDIKRSYPWFRIMAAAVILLIGTLGIIFFSNNSITDQSLSATVIPKKDIAPGSDKAVLTTADGTVILLDKKDNRVLEENNGNILARTKDGQLVYNGSVSSKEDAALNTLATPRGGQYQVLLPDGSKVFLNAASSLKYPTAFNGDTRKVILSGEAYFEIAKDKTKPFVVETGDAEVKVLGTHFNIMAYTEEQFSSATLLEGSVQFSRGKKKFLLKPGQQVKYQQDKDDDNVETADIETVMAWRKGIFVFDNTGVDEIMRNIKRWYNVDVVYAGPKPNISFTGVIPRTTNISKVLKVLEAAGDIAFDINGNKIICSKK